MKHTKRNQKVKKMKDNLPMLCKKRKMLQICLCISFFFGFYAFTFQTTQASIEETLPLFAENVVIYNLESDTLIYQKEEHSRVAPASLTKLMTALVVMNHITENQLEDRVVIVDAMLEGLEQRNATVNELRAGDVVAVRDLLKGMLISSAADSSNALAMYIESLQPESFVSLMNAMATELLLTDTHFANAHGLDEDDQYSTAYDMYQIGMQVLQQDLLVQLLGTNTDTMVVEGANPRIISLNHGFQVINPKSDIFTSSIVMGKTGYTGQAGRNVVAYLSQDDVSYLAVLMKAPVPTIGNHFATNLDLRQISDFVYRNYKLLPYQSKNLLATTRPISLSSVGKEIEIHPRQDPVLLVPMDATQSDVVVNYQLPAHLFAPIDQTSVVGQIEFTVFGEVMKQMDLVTNEVHPSVYASFLIATLAKNWMVVVAMILMYSLYLMINQTRTAVIRKRPEPFKDYYQGTKK